MTLQTTGALTLAQIQTEFGGVNPISLNEYYAGGANVPSGTSGTNGAVPASGQISMSQFYGTSDVVYALPASTYIDTALSPDDAQVTYTIFANGFYSVVGLAFGETLASGNWISPNTSSTSHYVKSTLSSGTFSQTAGADATWLALSTDKIWRNTFIGTLGTKTATSTFEISPNANGNPVVASGTVTLTATVEI